MTLILKEVLEHPALAEACPQLLSGTDQLGRMVRWIHSADLYDIAPLLRGNEVLLTNGVGLLGVDEAGVRTYVRRLAERPVAGLFFEVGRTFAEIPPAMVDEAQKLNLVLVVLQPVLRFTEVAEALNSGVIDRSVARLRHADEISRALSETLARGGTVAEILQQVADAVGSWAVLYDVSNQAVATAGEVDRSAHSTDVPILIEGTAWGRLALGTSTGSDLRIEAVLERAPRVIELCLIREQPGVASAFRGRQVLLEQLAAGTAVEASTLGDRLRAAGIPTKGHHYVCVVLNSDIVEDAPRVMDAVARECGQAVFGFVGRTLCAVLAARAIQERSLLAGDIQRYLSAELRNERRTCAAVGATLRSPARLPYEMQQTRLSLSICSASPMQRTVVRSRSVAIERVLLAQADREGMQRFVEEILGPIIGPDHRASSLLETLRVFVDCGGSKSHAASRLHLRRQSLYYRLRKISTDLEVDLDDPSQLAIFATAFAARRTLELLESPHNGWLAAGGQTPGSGADSLCRHME